MKNTIVVNCALILVGIFLLGTNPTLAQTTGRLKGRISDRSGGAIEAQIIVGSHSGKFEAVANDNGEFVLDLPSGTYHVSTKKVAGFVSLSRKKVQVKPGRDTVLNVRLKVTLDDAICVLYVTSAPIQKKAAGKKSEN